MSRNKTGVAGAWRMARGAVLVCAALMAWTHGSEAAPGKISGRIDVVDGDTLRVGGATIRLHGIDAPELAQSCTRKADGRDFACGAWVRDRVATLYQNARATCAAVDTDRYGRIVARCQSGGQDISARLVSDGLAFAYRHYSTRYVPQERRAMARDLGLHATRMQTPSEFRRTGADVARADGCRIKGNISGNGRIYHVPGQENYARTRISAAKGERWFCSEKAARAAGWRRAKR